MTFAHIALVRSGSQPRINSREWKNEQPVRALTSQYQHAKMEKEVIYFECNTDMKILSTLSPSSNILNHI